MVDNFLPPALPRVSLSYSTADLISSSYNLISSGGIESNPYFLLLGVGYKELGVFTYNAIDPEGDSWNQARKSQF